VRLLRSQIRPADLDRLVLTRRYWLVYQQHPQQIPPSAEATVRAFVDLELEERIEALNEALEAFTAQRRRWARVGHFVVADTSVYLQAEHKLEDLDLGGLLHTGGAPLHLIVPILVMDELDGQKQRGTDFGRWRAGYTLAFLSRLLRDPRGSARLRPEDFSALDTGGIPRGEITVEIVFDPPGHERLPISDDEIVDRAVAIKSASGMSTIFLTDDTGQAMRARARGLRVEELPRPALGAEPTRPKR
jgi:hypothetical protein